MIRKKKSIQYILFAVLAVVLCSCFASGTSPFFDLVHSFYAGNDSARALVAAESFLSGKMLYRDIYLHEGPVYLFFNILGWKLAGRFGVFLLECIIAFLILCITDKIVEKQFFQKYHTLITCFLIIPMAASMSGGNITGELNLFWAVLILKIALEETISKKGLLLSGILLSLTVFTQPMGGAVVYGAIIFLILRHASNILLILGGFFLGTIPWIAYFGIYSDLGLLFQALVLDAVSFDITSVAVLIRLLIKNIPELLLILLAVSGRKKNKYWLLYLIIGITAAILSLLHGGNWYMFYSVSICSILLLGSAVLFEKRVFYLSLLLLFGIHMVPMYRYAEYMCTHDMSLYNGLCTDLKSYEDKKEDAKGVFLINVPSYMYLELNQIPTFPYFAEQVTERVQRPYDELHEYLEHTNDVDLVVSRVYVSYSEEYGDYHYVDLYYGDGNTAYVIYEYMGE